MRFQKGSSAELLLAFGIFIGITGVAASVFRFPLHGLTFSLHTFSLLVLAFWSFRRRSLTSWIFWSMAAGVAIGIDAPHLAQHLRIFSDLFLRLIEVIMAPLILCVLITGIAGHGHSSGISRLAIKSFVYFEIVTTIALAVGLLAINASKAGVNLEPEKTATLQTARNGSYARVVPSAERLDWSRFALDAVPENLAKSIAENHILQVVIFAILFGLALGRLDGERSRPLLEFLHSLTAAMFQLTKLIMYSAPFAVGGALAFTVAHSGAGVMIGLGKLIATLYSAIAIFIVCGLLPVALIARVPLRQFLAAVAEPAAIAFATSTSEAALPISIENMEELGVPGRIAGFVIPMGYSFNLAGSALYLSLAAVFLAQAGGIHLGWRQQGMMLGTMVLTSKGVAGVPRAVFIVLLATAAAFHLPAELLPLLLGVDMLMDMGRAMINAAGNCLASVVIARWEGELVLSAADEIEDSRL